MAKTPNTDSAPVTAPGPRPVDPAPAAASALKPAPAAVSTVDPAPAAASTVDPAPAAASYEDALGELDRLVVAMEAGQLPLDQLLQNYRRGAELLGFCRDRLEAVEQQVRVLEDGQLKPWAAE